MTNHHMMMNMKMSMTFVGWFVSVETEKEVDQEVLIGDVMIWLRPWLRGDCIY